jgi:uncharacterized membrane protein
MKKMVFGLLAITLPMFVSWVTMMNLSHSHPCPTVTLCKDGKEYPIDNAHKFAQYLRDAQREIAEIIAKNGK